MGATTTPSWQSRTIGAVLASTASARGEAEAFVCAGRRLTYRRLYEAARRAASALLGLGVKRGDHVGVCMGNSAEWLTLFYANALIGAVTVPVNTRFRADELRYCLHQADVKALIVTDRFLKIDFVAMLRGICPAVDESLPGANLPRLERLIVLGSDVPKAALPFALLEQPLAADAERALDRVAAEVIPGDVALIQYTSGTTAMPKGVQLTHDNMFRNASAVADRIGIRADDRYYSARPYYHVAGTTLSILAALGRGACLLTTPVFDAGEALALMELEKCTLTSGNDTIFLMMMNHPRFAEFKLSLRGGWAAAGIEVMNQIRERMGMEAVVYCYGLSEASPNIICSRFDAPWAEREAGLARPHDGMAVRVVDAATGRDCPVGTTGEILVRGWSLMKGYYNKPEETAKAIDRDGWLRTGDLGALDAEGRLRFVGRAKDIFRVGGENVSPADVEEVLHRHPKVKQAQVIGVPDQRLGEVAAAYLILNEDATGEPEEFIAWCREHCANFKVPRYLKLIDSFEGIGMTGSSKVQKNKLKEQALIDFNLR
jgi:fatty-acyl-CoA synthase